MIIWYALTGELLEAVDARGEGSRFEIRGAPVR
jgi:hypothetical protein